MLLSRESSSLFSRSNPGAFVDFSCEDAGFDVYHVLFFRLIKAGRFAPLLFPQTYRTGRHVLEESHARKFGWVVHWYHVRAINSVDERNGYPPSAVEIAFVLGCRSRGSAHCAPDHGQRKKERIFQYYLYCCLCRFLRDLQFDASS